MIFIGGFATFVVLVAIIYVIVGGTGLLIRFKNFALFLALVAGIITAGVMAKEHKDKLEKEADMFKTNKKLCEDGDFYACDAAALYYKEELNDKEKAIEYFSKIIKIQKEDVEYYVKKYEHRYYTLDELKEEVKKDIKKLKAEMQ